jgi:exopolysaccharide biosynthesis polyprenyl glycosylphosphotransferase
MATLSTVSTLESRPLAAAALKCAAPGGRRSARGTLIARAARLAAFESGLALAALALVLVSTEWREMPNGLEEFLSIRVTLRNVLLLGVLAVGWPLLFRLCGLYEERRVRNAFSERIRVLAACGLGSVLALIIPVLSRSGGLAVRDVVDFWAVATTVTMASRVARRRILARPRRVLIVGSGVSALRLWQQLAAEAMPSYALVGFVSTPAGEEANEQVARHSIGTLDQLEAILMQHAVDEVRVELPVRSHYPQIQQAILVCERVGVRTKYRADLFDSIVAWPRFDDPGSPTVTLHVVADDHRVLVKRVIDVVGALVALVLFSPVMLAAAVAIRLTSRGPAIFAQERCGLNRAPFRMLKFRTMVVEAERLQSTLEAQNEAEGPVFKIAADPRVTRVGRFLRRTSIDELPQLFNVLRGEMSLVGPRPLPLRDVRRFTCAGDMRRFSVRPGLTCLWQISGRCNIGFREWISLDLVYIDRWSLLLDFEILLRTIPAVVRGTGAR